MEKKDANKEANSVNPEACTYFLERLSNFPAWTNGVVFFTQSQLFNFTASHIIALGGRDYSTLKIRSKVSTQKKSILNY